MLREEADRAWKDGSVLGIETRPEEWDTWSYQIGWLEQTLSCRWGLMPASVITIRKYKLLGFEMPRALGLMGQGWGSSSN